MAEINSMQQADRIKAAIQNQKRNSVSQIEEIIK